MKEAVERVKKENSFTGKETNKDILWFVLSNVIDINKNIGKINERSKTNRKLIYACFAFIIFLIGAYLAYGNQIK